MTMKRLIWLLLPLLVACGESKLPPSELGECIEAIDAEQIPWNFNNVYVDDYGYFCCVMSVSDLRSSPETTAESIYKSCCKPPLRGVKLINVANGNEIAKYKAER